MRKLPLELFFWITGLLFFTWYDPSYGSHLSICPLETTGFDFCPGCGLGKSIALLLHGKVIDSFIAHPLGLFAVIVLIARIFELIYTYRKLYGKNY